MLYATQCLWSGGLQLFLFTLHLTNALKIFVLYVNVSECGLQLRNLKSLVVCSSCVLSVHLKKIIT